MSYRIIRALKALDNWKIIRQILEWAYRCFVIPTLRAYEMGNFKWEEFISNHTNGPERTISQR